MSNPQFSPLTAPMLKLIGVILMLTFLLDFVVSLFPFNPLDQPWQINFTSQLVGTGFIPLVGLALLFVGYWIDNSARDLTKRQAGSSLKFSALLFSSFFGVLFLVLFPLHLNNVTQANAQVIQQINQEASQKETQLQAELGSPQAQTQLEEQRSRVKGQIDYLLKNEQQLNQVLQNNKVPEQFKTLLRQSQANPKAIDQLVQQQLSPEGLRSEIQRGKVEAEQKATQDAWKSGARIGLTSLLLAFGYLAISWTGWKSMGKVESGGQQFSAR